MPIASFGVVALCPELHLAWWLRWWWSLTLSGLPECPMSSKWSEGEPLGREAETRTRTGCDVVSSSSLLSSPVREIGVFPDAAATNSVNTY